MKYIMVLLLNHPNLEFDIPKLHGIFDIQSYPSVMLGRTETESETDWLGAEL